MTVFLLAGTPSPSNAKLPLPHSRVGSSWMVSFSEPMVSPSLPARKLLFLWMLSAFRPPPIVLPRMNPTDNGSMMTGYSPVLILVCLRPMIACSLASFATLSRILGSVLRLQQPSTPEHIFDPDFPTVSASASRDVSFCTPQNPLLFASAPSPEPALTVALTE